MRDGFVQINLGGEIVDVNRSLLEMTGYNKEEIFRLKYTEITPEKWLEYESKIFEREVIPCGYSSIYEKEYIRKDGTVFPVEMRTYLLKDPEKKHFGMWAIIRDITERKRVEADIKQKNETLSKLNSDKDLFLSIIAHDLKGPFNTVLGFLDLLKKNLHQYDMDKIEKFISIVNTSAHSYFHLLEDLLLWARSQSGRMPYNPQYLNYLQVFQYVSEVLGSIANTKNIKINNIANEEITLWGDLDMLKTVLRNLVSNAIKFNNEGGKVDICAERKEMFVTISVSDDGIGMEPEIITNLFDIRKTISTEGTAKESGTGLGLILCKEFVEKHGGEIWVESEVGKGSVFYFTLPLFMEKPA
ncbi:MAG: PAS domain S-box protein [Chloroflexia bacterium]|nr:PAS domain S-box protein [Chloroflexia bacterium]